MKKLRKITALLVMMVMALSLIPQAVLGAELVVAPTYTTAHEAYLQGWVRDTAIAENGTTIFTCVTDEIAHSGDHSFVLKSLDTGDKDLAFKQTVGLGEGTYTLSFWAAGTAADHDDDTYRYQQMVWLWGSSGNGWAYLSNMYTGEKDGDWTKYTLDFTVPAGATVSEFKLSTRGHGTEGLYIDDISIVRSGTTNNILSNGGFEETAAGEDPDVPEGPTYTTEFEPYFQGWVRDTAIAENGTTIFTCVTDEIAHSGDHSFVLKSLDTGDKDLAFKQTVGLGEGTYALSFWAAGTAADHDDDTYKHQQMVWLWGSAEQWAYLSNMYTGEKDGDWAKYTLDFTVPAGATVSEFKLSTRGHGTEGLYIDDISIVASGSTNNLVKNGSFDSDGSAEYTDAYEDYFTGWARNGGVTSNTTNVFACVTDAIAHSGEHSVVLKHTDSTQGGYMQIQQTSLSISAGTYTLSFWVSGEVNGQQVIWIKPGTTTANGDWLLINSAATGETEGAWTKYSTTFNVESGNTVTELTFGTSGNTDGLYLDDISIVAQGTTGNLLTNGGFEGTESGEEPDVPEGPTYTDAYEDYFQGWARNGGVTSNTTNVFACVTDAVAHSGEHSVVLKHTDSTQGGYMQIQQTSLSLSEGTYTLSFWVSGEVNGQQVIWIKPGTTTANGDWLLINSAATGETDGDWTKYSTTFNVESGNTVTELTFGTSGNTDGLYLDDISIVAQGTTENLLTNGGFEGIESGEEPEVPEGPTYTEAYEEYFSGWGRGDEVTQNESTVFACVTNEIAHSGSNSILLKHIDSDQSGYIQIQQTSLSLSEGTYTLSFWVAGEVNGKQVIWIKPGPTTANGDWLLINSAATGEVEGDWAKYSTNFTVEPENTVTQLTFGTNGDTTGLYIDDISVVAQGTTENLLKNGSFEERDSGAPVGDVVKEVVLKKNGQRIDTLDGQGDYSVTLILDNYAINTELDVEQLVAIYDEDGVLYGTVHSTATSIEKATADGAFTKIETSFTLPAGNYTVEYFVFDGRDTLNIIGSPNPHRIFE